MSLHLRPATDREKAGLRVHFLGVLLAVVAIPLQALWLLFVGFGVMVVASFVTGDGRDGKRGQA